jgi:phosphoribosyl-AMP cyclohydrolase
MLTLPIDIESIAFEKRDGLVPVVVQDAHDHRVLMLAYATRVALVRTCTSGEAWYWSTSRNELWRKGATSGNTQRVVRIDVDCDHDALIYVVEQRGNGTCHTGARSCFDKKENAQP